MARPSLGGMCHASAGGETVVRASQAVAVGIMLGLVTPTTPPAAAALDGLQDSLLLAD